MFVCMCSKRILNMHQIITFVCTCVYVCIIMHTPHLISSCCDNMDILHAKHTGASTLMTVIATIRAHAALLFIFSHFGVRCTAIAVQNMVRFLCQSESVEIHGFLVLALCHQQPMRSVHPCTCVCQGVVWWRRMFFFFSTITLGVFRQKFLRLWYRAPAHRAFNCGTRLYLQASCFQHPCSCPTWNLLCLPWGSLPLDAPYSYFVLQIYGVNARIAW